MANPFEFGRELSTTQLVDRGEEISVILETLREKGRLFLIGPRRFGKTSILRVASERAEEEGVVVLRHDAEAYTSPRLLAEALLAEAASRLVGSIERAGQKLREFFSRLRPELNFNPLDQTFSASMISASAGTEATLLTGVLDGLDRLAKDSERNLAVVIDEFQQLVENGDGLATERQIRVAIQRHDHVGYVFAGSKTSLLTEMTGDANRPFYRLGSRLFLGPVPRPDFRSFLRSGFEDSGFSIEESAIEAILDLSQDVPYNVQRLAHACWNALRDRGDETTARLGVMDVELALEQLVRRDDPFYTQSWNRLTATQQKALIALVENEGKDLYSRRVLDAYELPLSTARTAAEALLRTGVIRQEEKPGDVRLKLEDPFLAAWLRLFATGR